MAGFVAPPPCHPSPLSSSPAKQLGWCSLAALVGTEATEEGGSISPLPPHTSQRRWPPPSHSLQSPMSTLVIDSLPVPPQARQALVLWPWHFGHKTLFGTSSSGCPWSRDEAAPGGGPAPDFRYAVPTVLQAANARLSATWLAN